MKESKSVTFKNSVIKHLREQHFNINQPNKERNTFTVFSQVGIGFVIAFEKKHLLIANFVGLKNKNRRKLLEFVNDLNIRSFRMKFSIDNENILMMDTRLANIYQKKEFQNILEDISYDINDLLKGNNMIGEMLE